MADYVGAIDQGTTSTRFIVFDAGGSVVASDQREHEQICRNPGWVEHDPQEIWRNTEEVIDGALEATGIEAGELAAVGIANQRETTVVWERDSGRPVHNAIVWQDTRTAQICAELAGEQGPDRLRERTGLPISTYFSAPKLRWLFENVEEIGGRARSGKLLFGTMDSFLLWNLTGGTRGGLHLTDVTNASRTLLMSLETLDWDDDALELTGVPCEMLPEIRASSEVYGEAVGTLGGVAIAGALGDQQAALFGQTCFSEGEAKNTYGTGNFLLVNTGAQRVRSQKLLASVGYRLGQERPVYVLEGSIAVTGAAVQWLRDNLGLIDDAAQVEALALTVDDNGGAYFVPAFSGLFAPHWRDDARGVIAGLTRYVNRGHLARAVLEAAAYQTREVVDAVHEEADLEITDLRVDGGMVENELLMQFQADVLGVPVIRPTVVETTALGAAYAAGLAVGFWSSTDDLRANWSEDRRFEPELDAEARERGYALWRKAVSRSLEWTT